MNIFFAKSAERELLKLDKKFANKILEKISLLGGNPYGQNSEKLGVGKGYRIRIGDYRVVYIINKIAKTLTVVRIRHRRDVYR